MCVLTVVIPAQWSQWQRLTSSSFKVLHRVLRAVNTESDHRNDNQHVSTLLNINTKNTKQFSAGYDVTKFFDSERSENPAFG